MIFSFGNSLTSFLTTLPSKTTFVHHYFFKIHIYNSMIMHVVENSDSHSLPELIVFKFAAGICTTTPLSFCFVLKRIWISKRGHVIAKIVKQLTIKLCLQNIKYKKSETKRMSNTHIIHLWVITLYAFEKINGTRIWGKKKLHFRNRHLSSPHHLSSD